MISMLKRVTMGEVCQKLSLIAWRHLWTVPWQLLKDCLTFQIMAWFQWRFCRKYLASIWRILRFVGDIPLACSRCTCHRPKLRDALMPHSEKGPIITLRVSSHQGLWLPLKSKVFIVSVNSLIAFCILFWESTIRFGTTVDYTFFSSRKLWNLIILLC